MKGKLILFWASILICMLFWGCGREKTDNQSTGFVEGVPEEGITELRNIPQELEEIPETYYSPAKQQGKLVELYYDTYESTK